jgi:hypothetical protein
VTESSLWASIDLPLNSHYLDIALRPRQAFACPTVQYSPSHSKVYVVDGIPFAFESVLLVQVRGPRRLLM